MLTRVLVVSLVIAPAWAAAQQPTFQTRIPDPVRRLPPGPGPNKPTPWPAPLAPAPVPTPATMTGPVHFAPAPQQPAADAPAAPSAESLTHFDPLAAELVSDGGRWVLMAGGVTLKDFGNAQADAREALGLVRELRLSARGVVGGPRPVMEYWLSDGRAPVALGRHTVVPLDRASLQVQKTPAGWSVRDRAQTLFQFGAAEADARLALDVIRKYRFDKIGFVGRPQPTMVYLLTDRRTDEEEARAATTDAPATPAGPGRPLPQLTPRLSLSLPRSGPSGEVTPLSPRDLTVRRDAGGWVLAAGPLELARYGHAERDARDALRVVEYYRFSHRVTFGPSGFALYLSNGRPPRGSYLGVRTTPVRADRLAVEPVGDRFALCLDRRPVVDLGSGSQAQREGQLIAEAVEFLRLDLFCEVGSPGAAGAPLMFFAKQW